ncbi:MAG: hypothetical protein IJU25_00235, partial [Lachnospiraceae bacterium]|nr:hypothetical protein [Lachnospiraceae bacterium]
RIEVYHGYEKLVENRDYTIAYSDNTNAVLEPESPDPIAAITQIRTANARVKIPKVTIKGKGNYKSAKSFMFGIERADIDTAKVTTGNEMLVVAGNKTKLGNIKLNVVLEGKALKAKKDYELTYYHGDGVNENNLIASPAAEVISQSGSVYTILISAKVGSNLTGDRTVKVTSVASPDDLPVVVPKKDLSKVKIAGLNANVEYAGRPLVIADLFKEDNVTRNPDGNRDTDDAWTAVTLYTMDGKTKAKTVLREGTDYSVSMDNTGIPGKFTLTFTAKDDGDYEGVVKKTITIKPYNLKTDAGKNLIIDEIDDATYTKAGVTPSVTVKLVTEWNTDESGIRTTPKTFIKLKEGSDYTLTYKNNVKPQTKDAGKSAPTVTIKGTGNFTGANATATFTIKKADVMQVELSAQDVIYNSKGKAGYFMVAPKLMDDGKPVAVGKNREIDAIDKNAYEYFYAEDTELTDGTMKYAGSRMKATDPVPAGTLILVGVEVSVTAANSPYEQTNGTPLFGYYRVLAPGKDISKMSAGLAKGVTFAFQN